MSRLLPKNEHPIDRMARLGLGLLLVSLTAWGPHTLWGLVGLVPLATALSGSCPLYTLVGLSTHTAHRA